MKSQISNLKYQTNPKYRDSNFKTPYQMQYLEFFGGFNENPDSFRELECIVVS